MGKWRIARNITLVLLIVYVAMLATVVLGFAFDPAEYPDLATGLTRWEACGMVVGFILITTGLPLLADVAVLLVSLLMLRRSRRVETDSMFAAQESRGL